MLQLGDPQLLSTLQMNFLKRYNADNDWTLRMLWTDKAHFNLNGNVNTKNCVHWEDTNPHAVAPVPLFDAKVTV